MTLPKIPMQQETIEHISFMLQKSGCFNSFQYRGQNHPMNEQIARPRAVIFDIDGTLIPTTTICNFMAERMGHLDEIIAMEADWGAYKIDSETFATRDAKNYAGMAVAQVETWLEELPLIVGLDEVCRRLMAAGRAIALNARPDAKAVTKEHLDTGDLRDLLPLLGF